MAEIFEAEFYSDRIIQTQYFTLAAYQGMSAKASSKATMSRLDIIDIWKGMAISHT